ncbi:pilus assembly protein TadG-related protein [Cognatishimia maritima]|uniref:Putative Flp pilus-assembly TadE/G-like n=1 Tax=Cognatishimia maritima TaxID=870908 RepID=A0A1M5NZC8_9RHOB|nr:pilus assembly protein TadG-related protein [Cognatishimia maritima]SHG94881.1 Putative Flp pilus-assembly TadE/G-like [Cognatishimia maritima]
MRRFTKDQNGFILVLSLLSLPIFIGFGLLIIDLSRVNNAHSDLALAADAVALAGAGELDGGSDAITRAQAAMSAEGLVNTVSMLATSGDDTHISLEYEDVDGNEFTVIFLTNIPDDDRDPIDQAWVNDYATTDGTEAEFVYVHAQSRDLITAFFNPISYLRETVPVAAIAVAMSESAICDIPPLFMCNPLEDDGYAGDALQEGFEAGDLHARIFKLHPKGSDTAAPGNFGYLSIDGTSSADALRDYFAGAQVPRCFAEGIVTTKPGAAESIAQGYNVRFDIYEGNFNSPIGTQPGGDPWPEAYGKPAVNVRKGIRPRVNGSNVNHCVTTTGGGSGGTIAQKLGDDHINDEVASWDPMVTHFGDDGLDDDVFGLPDDFVMDSGGVAAGAVSGSGGWPIDVYMQENYGHLNVPPDSVSGEWPTSSHPVNATPSRYDVYLWEQNTRLDATDADLASGIEYFYQVQHPGTYDPAVPSSAPDSENGEAMCGPEDTPTPKNSISDPDRRVTVVAIIDCNSASAVAEGGGVNDYIVNSYASVFMVRPMIDTIDIEIVDITGYGGNGTLDTFIRKEAILVR